MPFPARISKDPRRAVNFKDAETPNAIIAARKAGIIRGDSFSGVMDALAIGLLKKRQAACERKGIKLPKEVYAD